MSFIFRGSRGDIEDGFPGIIPERSPLRIRHVRSVNTNSLMFLVTVLLLFTMLNTHQMSPSFLLWLALGVFLVATSLRVYATWQQLRAQSQVLSASGIGLSGPAQFHLQMPDSIALASRRRLQGLRLQLALLDREFNDLDYETLRTLDSDNVPNTPSMTEVEINALPVHKYKVTEPKSGESKYGVSSSSSSPKAEEDGGSAKGAEDDLTCTICLDQVNRGELLRTLPCLHQFHAHCIDPWLKQQGTCPVCKLRVVGLGMQDNLDFAADLADIV
ncbi:E3 ubiquitin-protein ligase SDIR1-like isoform X2 [Silene latifolia]|uniref:E3 ubiquitin-protein ligase SDIR1-like isoform X2 n=1 Tax=Silene latifolia TaxID=37657 RepID=UPI003D773A4F